jgi:hypothetical protein
MLVIQAFRARQSLDVQRAIIGRSKADKRNIYRWTASTFLSMFVFRRVSFRVGISGAFVMDDWKKQLDVLVEETMAFVRNVSGDASKKIDFRQTVAPRELQGVPELMQLAMAAKVAPPIETLDRESDMIQRCVANFKANQKKFQNEREEYYARTMSAARATQRTPRSHGNDKLIGPTG